MDYTFWFSLILFIWENFQSKNIAIGFANMNRPLYSIWLVESNLLAFWLVDGIVARILKPICKVFWDLFFSKGKISLWLSFLPLFSSFYTFEERNMSVATYFTNISNVSDRQKRFFCDLGEENLPVWSKYHFDVSSSQDSNSSVNSSNSSKRLVMFCSWYRNFNRSLFQVN